MNTEIDLFVEGDRPPLDLTISVRLLFEEHEARFSRFRETSLLSALNRGGTVENAQFATVCRMSIEAHEFTGGLFNPMVLPALRDAGYAASFESVAGGWPRPQEVPSPAACLELRGNAVRLREGQLDLGGIVKGWSVDTAFELFGARYPDLFLNAGGDLRCCGVEEGTNGWLVSVPRVEGSTAWEGTMTGALATSTSEKRRWRTDDGGRAHHLIDPRSGLPAENTYRQVSVWGAQTWVSEVWAKAVLIGGADARAACDKAGFRVLALGD